MSYFNCGQLWADQFGLENMSEPLVNSYVFKSLTSQVSATVGIVVVSSPTAAGHRSNPTTRRNNHSDNIINEKRNISFFSLFFFIYFLFFTIAFLCSGTAIISMLLV